ncbi:hypothetical protein DDZ13_01750 [Coraliomargarita sinensis]|uniref:Uncharacterized protein n=1 Tax=Coraliomargarita sinensis TaxID=2174842 RepID=A0A317ZKS6_9BACT|nr:hypothetical protein [Coraliomargarita sinensis]PXA05622.1 hypothetical protein DDZ13_01750 [Coraliomargarita sinensis]
MIKKLLKALLYVCLMLACLMTVLVFWMRMGEEEPLDYSPLNFELGPEDPEINGYTYLREFCQDNHDTIPENYPIEYSEDYEIQVDYDRYENWDLEFFKEILEANADFMAGVEAAFERPIFMPDREFFPENIAWHVSYLRSYLILRKIESRVLHLSGDSEAALARLADLADELSIHAKSGDALIGLLTNVAMNGILTHELWVYQANIKISAEQLKRFAKDYDIAEYYADAVKLALKQEFQFMCHATKDTSEVGAVAYQIPFMDAPSKAELLLQRTLLYVGFRKTRTLNEMFQLYSELVRQFDRPLSQRNFEYANAVGENGEGKGWGSYINRNPIGGIIRSTLTRSMTLVLNKISMAEVSASATRLSMALQAYYMEHESLPDRLDELVPEYLPMIPRDPYDGQPMRYSKERKIVYSVGDDFVDHGGSEKSFQFQVDYYDDEDAAEHDTAEPTYPLRFAM